eukprot:802632-Rhodomonas_salina.1
MRTGSDSHTRYRRGHTTKKNSDKVVQRRMGGRTDVSVVGDEHAALPVVQILERQTEVGVLDEQRAEGVAE